jgi:prophage maintenance system killer protein
MSSNHGFVDGNKRTTLILLHTLLSKSGYRLIPIEGDPPLQVAVEEMILAAVNHLMDYDDLVQWFKLRIEPL